MPHRDPTRIGVDGRNLLLPHGTGVARYGQTVIAACHRLGLQPELVVDRATLAASLPIRNRRGNGLKLLRAALPFRHLHDAQPDTAGLPLLASPDLFRVAQQHFDLYRRPLKLRCKTPPALMHWTYPLPLHLSAVPNLVTIHDLIPLQRPDLTSIDGARMRRMLHAILRLAARILTVSETVRGEIVSLLGVHPDRVVNIYQAWDLPDTLLQAARTAPQICPPGSFICIGTVTGRKNVGRLIAAHRKSGVAIPLVIIGPDGEDAAAEMAMAEGPHVLRVPWVAQATLVRAMQESRAVLFPSLAEGFGLPIIEAMALGTPVMTSRSGATGEIAGDAAALVDPLDLDDMANTIASLAADASLCTRLRVAGLARAAIFSMESFAARLGTIYDDARRWRIADAAGAFC